MKSKCYSGFLIWSEFDLMLDSNPDLTFFTQAITKSKWETHLVLPTFHASLSYWYFVDFTPVGGTFLPLFQPVPDDHRASSFSGRFPGQSHGGLGVLCNSWLFWWARETKWIYNLDLLRSTRVRNSKTILSSDSEHVVLVGLQGPDL